MSCANLSALSALPAPADAATFEAAALPDVARPLDAAQVDASDASDPFAPGFDAANPCTATPPAGLLFCDDFDSYPAGGSAPKPWTTCDTATSMPVLVQATDPVSPPNSVVAHNTVADESCNFISRALPKNSTKITCSVDFRGLSLPAGPTHILAVSGPLPATDSGATYYLIGLRFVAGSLEIVEQQLTGPGIATAATNELLVASGSFTDWENATLTVSLTDATAEATVGTATEKLQLEYATMANGLNTVRLGLSASSLGDAVRFDNLICYTSL